MKRDIVVFAHVPKTAGSTMRQILTRQYPPGRVVIERNLVFPHVLESLRERLETGRPGTDAVGGHVGYGFHSELPDSYRYRYFTFLRSPVERVISNYYQWQRSDKIPDGLPFSAFVRDYPLGARNLQTAFVAGHLNQFFLDGREVVELMSDDVFAEVDPSEILARAKTNLDAHEVVGLTERFDESLLLMAEAFDWPWYKLPYLRHNVGHNRPVRARIPDDVREEIAAHNQLDLELYEYAEARFARQMEDHGERMSRQLSRLRRANAMVGAVVPPLMPVLRPIYQRIRATG